MSYPVAMSECGWMALGIGTTMTDADIIMVWGNADNSWTLSHRTADNTVEPKLTDSTAPKDTSTDATGSVGVVASLSSSTQADSPTVVTFVRPLKAPTGYVTTAKVKDVAQVINTVSAGLWRAESGPAEGDVRSACEPELTLSSTNRL